MLFGQEKKQTIKTIIWLRKNKQTIKTIIRANKTGC